MNFSLKNRIKCERRIVSRVVADALKLGYYISVNDGEETVLRVSRTRSKIMAALFSTDEDCLMIHLSPEKHPFGKVWFVYGNDGPDVIHDYTLTMEHVVSGANKLAGDIEERGL